MPEQQQYVVKNTKTGEDLIFPAGTPEPVMEAWYNGDESARKAGAPQGAPPGLPSLGMGFPDTSKELRSQVGEDGLIGTSLQPRQDTLNLKNLGKMIEFVAGFTPARPIPLAIGMGASALGNLMQGGDPADAAASAGLTGGGGILGRQASELGTAAGLRAARFKPNPASEVPPSWRSAREAAPDFYDLKNFPTTIGMTRRIQGEVDQSGKLLADAMAGKTVNLGDVTAGAADDVLARSPKARGTDPIKFRDSAQAREADILKQKLEVAGLSPRMIGQMDLQQLRGAARMFNIPMEEAGAIKQVADKAGVQVRNAADSHKQVVASPADATAETNSAVASRARSAQRQDPAVSSALDRSARAQRVRAANNQVLNRNPEFPGAGIPSFTQAMYSGGIGAGLYRATAGSPSVLSAAGLGTDQLIRLLLAGYRLTQDGQLIKDNPK